METPPLLLCVSSVSGGLKKFYCCSLTQARKAFKVAVSPSIKLWRMKRGIASKANQGKV